MRGVGGVNYLQIDEKVREMREESGVIVMKSCEAWKRYKWTRKYFREKPKQGYFIWVRKSIRKPIATCVLLASKNVEQRLNNLLILDEGVKVKVIVSCAAVKRNLCSAHFASGNVVLKRNATLVYEHIHNWMNSKEANMSYNFYLESEAKLSYRYKAISPAREMKIKATTALKSHASSDIRLAAMAEKSRINVEELSHLLGKDSSSMILLRFVTKEEGRIYSKSKLVADEEAKGHIDCQGLIVGKNASITLTPELQNNCERAILTHEASIGRIAKEQLDYLRSRGLSERDAISLIVRGFLEW